MARQKLTTVQVTGRVTPAEAAALRKYRFANEIETGGEVVTIAIREFIAANDLAVEVEAGDGDAVEVEKTAAPKADSKANPKA